MKIQKKRRNEKKTDYGRRLKLLKSGRPRVVFRKTNKYIISQYITSIEAKDKVVFGVTSKDLLKSGWPEKAQGSLKSISASYLTGYLIGKQIIKRKLETPIIDSGMVLTIKGNKFYALIKGLIDSGVEIICDEKSLPAQERIEGQHLKNKIDVQKIKSGIDKL